MTYVTGDVAPWDLDALLGNRSVLRGYAENTFDIIGDSRNAQSFIGYSTNSKVRNPANYITQALAASGQRAKVGLFLAASGQRSDQYLSPANQALSLASPNKWTVLGGVLNDISQTSGVGDYWNTTIRPFVEAKLARGYGMVLVTETGSFDFTTTATRGAVHRYNAQIKAFAVGKPNVRIFDAAALVLLPDQPLIIDPAYSGDGRHINTIAGARRLSDGTASVQGFASLLKEIMGPQSRLPRTVGEVFANGGIQWFPNPLWLTTTGGVAANVTGVLPAGLTAGGTSGSGSGATAVGSVVAGPYGNDYRLQITTTAAGCLNLVFDLQSIGTENPGDVFTATTEFSLASGHSNFQSACLILDSTRGGVARQNAGGPVTQQDGVGNMPAGAYSWVEEVEPLIIGSGSRTQFQLSARFWFSAAGTADISMRQLGVQKIVT